MRTRYFQLYSAEPDPILNRRLSALSELGQIWLAKERIDAPFSKLNVRLGNPSEQESVSTAMDIAEVSVGVSADAIRDLADEELRDSMSREVSAAVDRLGRHLKFDLEMLRNGICDAIKAPGPYVVPLRRLSFTFDGRRFRTIYTFDLGWGEVAVHPAKDPQSRLRLRHSDGFEPLWLLFDARKVVVREESVDFTDRFGKPVANVLAKDLARI